MYTENTIPSIGTGARTEVATSTSATADTGAVTNSGPRVFWFYALTEVAYVVFGKAGSVTTPTVNNGWPCPVGVWTPYRVPAGVCFQAIAAGNGKLIYKTAVAQ